MNCEIHEFLLFDEENWKHKAAVNYFKKTDAVPVYIVDQ